MKKFSRTLAVMLAAVVMILPGTVEAAPVVKETVVSVERIAGKGRVETAVDVSKIAYKEGAEAVVLSGYRGEVDALPGTLLANAQKAPLLLTEQNGLSKATKDEIVRLKAKTVYLLGGEAVISEKVLSELNALEGVTAKRVSGSNRYETAHKIAEEVKGKTNHVFLALGDVLADALSVGPVSAIRDMPVLLTTKNYIPQETKDAMDALGVTHVTIVGGESAISKDLKNELAKSYTVDRVNGKNREGTAEAIAKKYFTNPTSAIVTNDGRVNYADALVGGYLGALKKAPILLTQANALPSVTRDYMETHTAKAFVLGGKTVVGEKVFENAKTAVIDELIASKTTTLTKNYKSVKVTGNDIVVDLADKTVGKMLVTSNDAVIKNGTVNNITIGKDVTNVTLEDISDDGAGNHEFEGGGAESIILKGKTKLKSAINISSATPIRIRAENLAAGKGMTGKVTVNTEAAVTIAAPVQELEIKKANKAIKIDAVVGKVSALADVTITVAKDVKMPTLEKAKGVKATATDSTGKEVDFEVNEKLEPTEPTPPSYEPPVISIPEKIETTKLSVSTYSVNSEVVTPVTFRYRYNGTSKHDFYLLENKNGVFTPYQVNGKDIQLKDDGRQNTGDLLENDGIYSTKVTIKVEEGYLNFVVGVKEGDEWKVVSTVESILVVKPFTPTEVKDLEKATKSVKEIIQKPNLSKEKIIEEVLKNNIGKIEKAEASESGESIWFTLESGVLGAVSLVDDAENAKNPQTASLFSTQATNVEKDKSINVGNALAVIFSSEGSTNESALKTAFEENYILKSLKGNEATVEEFKKLSEYGTVIFDTKGESLFKGNLKENLKYLDDIFADKNEKIVISTGELANDKSLNKYNADLKTGRLVIVDDYFAITPAFVKYYTTGQDKPMDDALVYANTNQSMFNTGMAQMFLDNGAQTYIGYEGAAEAGELVSVITSMLADETKTVGEAVTDKKAKLHGNKKLVLKAEQKFLNGGLEDGLRGWIGAGHIDTITRLGSGNHASWHTITPREGNAMGIISSGVDTGALSGRQSWIYQTLTVPENMTNLKFDYNIASSEPMGFIGSVFDDKFKATIVEGVVKEPGDDEDYIEADNGWQENNPMTVTTSSKERDSEDEIQTLNMSEPEPLPGPGYESWLENTIDKNEKIIGFESINSSDWGQDYSDDRQRVAVEFPHGDNTTYMTGWKTVNYDVTKYQGKTITLKLQVWDLGDTAYPTAVLFDNVRLTKADYTGVGIEGRAEVKIPRNGTNEYFYQAGKIDLDGDILTGEIKMYEDKQGYVKPIRELTAKVKLAEAVEGVEIDEATGILTVKDTAKVGEITLIAFDDKDNQKKITVKLAEPEPSVAKSLAIQGDRFIINRGKTEKYTIDYKAIVLDQYGEELPAEYDVKWSLEEGVVGLSIDEDTGILTINPELLEKEDQHIFIEVSLNELNIYGGHGLSIVNSEETEDEKVALEAVVKAEETKLHENQSKAGKLVNNLSNDMYRQYLFERLNSIEIKWE